MRISDWSSDVCSSDLARRARDAERRFAQSGASIAVVDARGAAELGLEIARTLSGTVEAMGAAMLVLLPRGAAALLGDVYDAGATQSLISPFGALELGTAMRFPERFARRLGHTSRRPHQFAHLTAHPPSSQRPV